MDEHNDRSLFGDSLLDAILRLSDTAGRQESVLLVNPARQKALSVAYDSLEAIARNSGAGEKISVQYYFGARCTALTAVLSGLCLNTPWVLAAALVEASNVQIQPVGDGDIRISLYFRDYFRVLG